MSLLSNLGDIVTALNTVDDVKGYQTMPATPNVGDAWPVLQRGDRAAGIEFTNTWRVRVVVPNKTELDAITWWDAHWDPLFYALDDVLMIDSYGPILVPTRAGDIWAYEIIGRTGE